MTNHGEVGGIAKGTRDWPLVMDLKTASAYTGLPYWTCRGLVRRRSDSEGRSSWQGRAAAEPDVDPPGRLGHVPANASRTQHRAVYRWQSSDSGHRSC